MSGAAESVFAWIGFFAVLVAAWLLFFATLDLAQSLRDAWRVLRSLGPRDHERS